MLAALQANGDQVKKLLLICAVLMSGTANAAVTSAYTGEITGVRVEGTIGLLSMASYIEDGEPRCNRVWLDLLKDEDKAAYSTALMAFTTGKVVQIRAVQASTLRYGACDLYDIYVGRQ